MYRLQVPVLEQLQCRVKKPKTDSEQPITMKPNRNLWEWTTIKFNFIYELYTVLGKRKEKKKKSAIRHSVRLKKKKKGGGDSFYDRNSITTQILTARFIHPQEFSCSVFKPPNSTPLFTLFVCVEGTLPVALTYSSNLLLYLNIHKSTLQPLSQKKETEQFQSHIYIQEYVFRNKINMETFPKNKRSQKSVFSNQAHHTPHQTDILYIQMVLPNDTRASTP